MSQHNERGSFYIGPAADRITFIAKKEKRGYNHYSIVSIFSFFTKGLLISSGIQAGLFSGALTISFHPWKTPCSLPSSYCTTKFLNSVSVIVITLWINRYILNKSETI